MLSAGYEFERPLSAPMDGQTVAWMARVQVVHSQALAQRQEATLAKRPVTAEAELKALPLVSLTMGSVDDNREHPGYSTGVTDRCPSDP